MKPVTIIRRTLAPLPRANVDTDQIMPKEYLKRVERTGYGDFVFADWRKAEPDFVLDRSEYAQAGILVAGPNFGSGSSREHAPWGLQDWGFEALIAPSFADIFFNNCTKIGLLPVILDTAAVNRLTESALADPAALATIDLAAQTVAWGDDSIGFPIDAFTKYRLLNGLDDIGLSLRHEAEITRFESGRAEHLPSL